MKKLLVLFVFVFSIISAFAQSESVKPTFGVNLERVVSYASINGETHTNLTVELRAAELGDPFVEGVRVIVTDNETGKKIYEKRFWKSYLYAFSDGTIEVGKGNALTQISLYKSKGDWIMNLREKGIY